jgi:putative effector of murein hydrolase LrgA (UPF0299 family)
VCSNPIMVADNIASFVAVLIPSSIVGLVFFLLFCHLRTKLPDVFDVKSKVFKYVSIYILTVSD